MWIARARSLLGTMVSIQVQTSHHSTELVERAILEAFSTMSHISLVMSAHHKDSDLGRLSRAQTNEVLTLDAETMHVIRAAQHWTMRSGGAFNACVAAQTLSRLKQRPGIAHKASGTLQDIHFVSETAVQLSQAVNLDFGGIAKGYAVDRAIDVLCAHGIQDALVNAGGDLRAIGTRQWLIDIRHANKCLMNGHTRQKKMLHQKALATSVSGVQNPEFVFTRHHIKPRWTSVTVQASTCMAADALTKWAMQSTLLCSDLHAALRQNHGRMWRTR